MHTNFGRAWEAVISYSLWLVGLGIVVLGVATVGAAGHEDMWFFLVGLVVVIGLAVWIFVALFRVLRLVEEIREEERQQSGKICWDALKSLTATSEEYFQHFIPSVSHELVQIGFRYGEKHDELAEVARIRDIFSRFGNGGVKK